MTATDSAGLRRRFVHYGSIWAGHMGLRRSRPVLALQL